MRYNQYNGLAEFLTQRACVRHAFKCSCGSLYREQAFVIAAMTPSGIVSSQRARSVTVEGAKSEARSLASSISPETFPIVERILDDGSRYSIDCSRT